MSTTPQPIQQQAFSFTPPGTFSQGFGFVPTRLRIDNPSSYYLSFPKVPALGIITPYTFGAVVPWNQSDGSVTITTDYTPENAPTLPSSNAQVTVLASTDSSLLVQSGTATYSATSTEITGGSVTVEPGSNPVAITGSVDIGNNPTVDIAAGASVGISGSPTVDIAAGATVAVTNDGTTNLNVNAAIVANDTQSTGTIESSSANPILVNFGKVGTNPLLASLQIVVTNTTNAIPSTLIVYAYISGTLVPILTWYGIVAASSTAIVNLAGPVQVSGTPSTAQPYQFSYQTSGGTVGIYYTVNVLDVI